MIRRRASVAGRYPLHEKRSWKKGIGTDGRSLPFSACVFRVQELKTIFLGCGLDEKPHPIILFLPCHQGGGRS
ncbi:hypothetical protein HMPREF3038_01219 [Akkermansia sp. KLE1797]|nr:hypothetical protein HMPREF3038_01219 [Akkermansia sp. KLE1797]